MTKKAVPFALGLASGFAVALTLGVIFIMPPSEMVRWLQDEEPIKGRLARVFDPIPEIVRMRGEAVQLRNAALVCKADIEEQRKRADNLEFKLEAAVVPKPQPGAKDQPEACGRDYDTVRGIHLKRGEGLRHAGGRIYVGLEDVAGGGYQWCKVRASSDIKDSYGDLILLKIAEALRIESFIGSFRLVPTRLAPDAPDGPYCEFDLVREP